MDHAFWGPGYTDEEIEAAIKTAKVRNFHKSSDLPRETAQLVADNKVVGWFQGRLEIGPRALGGRSIVGNPKNPEMKDIVNNNVKHREPWRPFAPSFLEEAFAPYVEHPHDSPFMILAFRAKDEKVEDVIAASHVDKTLRVQTVKRHTNRPYWEMISAFEELTGVPAVLNTSFNVAGQPIVATPFDAIGTFYGTGMDYLAIGNYIIEK
jgi:carbamoyltransferase